MGQNESTPQFKEDWENEYTKVRKLGKGVFGTVYLVRGNESKELYALKEIRVSSFNRSDIKSALKEAKVQSFAATLFRTRQ